MTDGTFNATYFDDEAVLELEGELGRGGPVNQATSENTTGEEVGAAFERIVIEACTLILTN